MKIFEPLYTKTLEWARHPKSEGILAGLSFAESSFFPIPPDVMLAPMVLANRERAWRYAAVTTVMSVIGGVFGFAIGSLFFDSFGMQLLDWFNAHDAFSKAKLAFNEYGVWILLIAGFTPIPYKVFTIASGVVGMALLPFILVSFVGRGARFFLVAGLIRLGGEKMQSTIHQKVEWIGWITLALIIVVIAWLKLH